MPDKVKPVFPFHFDIIRIMNRVRYIVFLKYALPSHELHLFPGGRDHVRDILAGLDLFKCTLDEVPTIGAELGNFEERIFLLEFLGDGSIPGVRAVKHECPFFLGAFDENLFPVSALVEG